MTSKTQRYRGRLVIPALTLAVAFGTVAGFVVLDRAIPRGRAPIMPRPSQAAPLPPTPSASPNSSEFVDGRDCLAADVVGDFDGDGRMDQAVVYPKMFIEPPTCEHDTLPSWNQVVSVSLATGMEIHFEFDCLAVLCRFQGWNHPGGLFVAPDFDGDGRAELAVNISQGATFSLFTVYLVTPEGLQEVELAPPGDPQGQFNEVLSPGPVRLLALDDLYSTASVTCASAKGGSRVVVQVSGRRIADSPRWRYHKTVLAFEGDTFTVISSRDAVIPRDSPLFINPGLSSCT
jgi:hypothetical protein